MDYEWGIIQYSIRNQTLFHIMNGVLGESLMAVKKDRQISQVVMVITRKILHLLRVAGGHE